MDAYSEPVTETSQIDALPDAVGEEVSFDAALEAAFDRLENATAEPTDKPAAEEVQPESKPDSDKVESDEPIEQLTDDIGDDWTPKAANRFKQLKDELKNNRSELEMLRSKTTEYESKIQELTGLTESKDYEQLQAKLAEYEQQKMFTDLENTTAYQQAVTQPLAALMEQADIIADKYEIDSDTLIDIIALDDSDMQEERLAELLPNASDRDKAKIFRIMEEVEPILQRRQKMFENADQAMAEAKLIEEQNQRQEAARRAQFRENIARNVVERVQQKLPFLSGFEGLDMSTVQKRAAESDPTTIHAVDHAYNAVSAQLLPAIVKQYVSLQKEIGHLTDRLAEYENAEPTMSGASKDSRSSAPTSGSFEERVNAALSGML